MSLPSVARIDRDTSLLTTSVGGFFPNILRKFQFGNVSAKSGLMQFERVRDEQRRQKKFGTDDYHPEIAPGERAHLIAEVQD
ncbi:hypothetical protein [Methylocapsa aurea]|uniref:hypothetical protein n=1 Tax=Methylocapsa aurea TaxID=663610 RepID=UPI003D188273